MKSDPRIGLVVSLAIAAAALLWLIAMGFAGEDIQDALGDLAHVITFLSIFLLITGIAVSFLFRRYWRVRSDLLAGRNVIERWVVDPEAFKAFATVADTRDRADKRGALMLMFFFIVVIFGGFILFDPEVALPMLGVAAALALVLTGAYFWSNRIRRKQLEPTSREVIVGNDGLLVNDVLHVWGVFMSWLAGVELERGARPILTITYAYLARYGPQYVSVPLPVPPGEIARAEEVERRLGGRLEASPRRRAARRAGRSRKVPAARAGELPADKNSPTASD